MKKRNLQTTLEYTKAMGHFRETALATGPTVYCTPGTPDPGRPLVFPICYAVDVQVYGSRYQALAND